MKRFFSFLIFNLLFIGSSYLSYAQEGCSINENVDMTFCLSVVQANGGFPLQGGVSSGVVEHKWSLVSSAPGANVEIQAPELLSTTVVGSTPTASDFTAGTYEFLLIGICIVEGQAVEVSESLTVTLTDPPVLTVNQTGGQGSNGVYQTCREITFTVTDDLPAGIGTRSWVWTPFGNEDFDFIVLSSNQVLVKVVAEPEICGIPVELTYTVEGAEGCISETTMEVTFTGSNSQLTGDINLEFCASDFRVVMPFPGCDVDYNIAFVSSDNGTQPVPVPYFNNNQFDGYNFYNMAAGNYHYVFTTSNAGLCNPITRNVYLSVLGDFELAGIPDEIYCDGTPTTLGPWNVNDVLPAGAIATDIDWFVNCIPPFPPLDGVYEDITQLSLSNVPDDTRIGINLFVTDQVTGCRDNSFFVIYVDNPISTTQNPLQLDCGEPFEEFVLFDDYVKFRFNPNSSTRYLVDFTLESFPSTYTPAWLTADWDNNLGFFATDVGEYVFTITSTVAPGGGLTPCVDTETFTVIVGPGGELANAGTDFLPTCVESTILVGNTPQDVSVVDVFWTQIDGNPPVTFDLTNPYQPTVSNLQNLVYEFEYTIVSIFDETCFDSDQVILDNTKCECPDIEIAERWSPEPICYGSSNGVSQYGFRISLGTWALDNFENCAQQADITSTGTFLGPVTIHIVGGELVVEGLIEMVDGVPLCLNIPLCIDGIKCPYDFCFPEELEPCEKECEDGEGITVTIPEISFEDLTGSMPIPPNCSFPGDGFLYDLNMTIQIDVPNTCPGEDLLIDIFGEGTGQLCNNNTQFQVTNTTGTITIPFSSLWSAGGNQIFCFKIKVKKLCDDYDSCFETFCFNVPEYLKEMRPGGGKGGEGGKEDGGKFRSADGSTITNLNAITLSPNPTRDLVVLHNPHAADYQMMVFSSQGVLMMQQLIPAHTNETLSLKDLGNGIYFVNLIDSQNGEQFVKRLVVMD